MARNLIGLPRDYHHPSQFVGGSEARRGDGSNSIIAMHWDGTYRDRMWSEAGDFWPNEEDFEDVSASHIAQHLA